MGKDDEAVAEYRRAIKLAPKGYYLEVELTGRVIDIYRRKQALPALLAEYEKAWPEGSRGHFEWDTLGKLYEETGAQDKAIAALKKAVAKARVGARDAARADRSCSRTRAAMTRRSKQYEAVVRAAPGEARFQLELAERYWRRGQEKKGARDARRACRAGSRATPACSPRSRTCTSAGARRISRSRQYERLAKLEPDDPGHLVTLGEQYWQKNDATRALATWKRLTATGKATGFAKLGEVMAEHGNETEALANFDKAIKLDDKNPEFYKGRAGVYESQEAVHRGDRGLGEGARAGRHQATDRLARRDARRHIVVS